MRVPASWRGLRADRQQTEAVLQKQVVKQLRANLPSEVWKTASLSGVTLTAAIAGQAKAAGMEKGAPDLSFIWPDGDTTYIELKSATGTLTPEQKALAVTLGPRLSVCRSWQAVKDALTPRLASYGLRWLTDTESVRRAA